MQLDWSGEDGDKVTLVWACVQGQPGSAGNPLSSSQEAHGP